MILLQLITHILLTYNYLKYYRNNSMIIWTSPVILCRMDRNRHFIPFKFFNEIDAGCDDAIMYRNKIYTSRLYNKHMANKIEVSRVVRNQNVRKQD